MCQFMGIAVEVGMVRQRQNVWIWQIASYMPCIWETELTLCAKQVYTCMQSIPVLRDLEACPLVEIFEKVYHLWRIKQALKSHRFGSNEFSKYKSISKTWIDLQIHKIISQNINQFTNMPNQVFNHKTVFKI